MADQETWASRVQEWKASGLTSARYCEGKPFTAGGLRHWAYRLGRGRSSSEGEGIRLAKVVRIPSPKTPTVDEATEGGEQPALVLAVGAVRIEVRSGFDRDTLAAVLELLATTGSRQ